MRARSPIDYEGGEKMRILQVVVYPLDEPRHGGQIRCRKIFEALKSYGHQVTLLTCLTWEGASSKLGPTIGVPTKYRDSKLGVPLSQAVPTIAMEDYFATPEGRKQILEQVDPRDFDLVWVDQQYMFRPLKRIFAELGSQALFAYSSQNVEHLMHAGFLPAVEGLSLEEIEMTVALIRDQEIFAVEEADFVIAVTQDDASELKSWQKQNAQKILVMPNASEEPEIKSPEKRQVTKVLNLEKYALFVASGHRPNFIGFQEMLGNSLSFVPLDFKIVCVGSVVWNIDSWSKTGKHSENLRSRLVLLDNASDSELSELKDEAQIILLPITTGGGSNLKTAEALLSGKTILATDVAFRGFEHWQDDPGVHIARTAAEFQLKLCQLARKDTKTAFLKHESTVANPLTWGDALSSLPKLLDTLVTRSFL